MGLGSQGKLVFVYMLTICVCIHLYIHCNSFLVMTQRWLTEYNIQSKKTTLEPLGICKCACAHILIQAYGHVRKETYIDANMSALLCIYTQRLYNVYIPRGSNVVPFWVEYDSP